MHKEYGEDFLCETCKSYPRFASMYEDVYVLSLAPSCPAVLNILKEENKPFEIDSKLYYESEEEINSPLNVSDELKQKLMLRGQLLMEITKDGNCLEQKISKIEEKFGTRKRDGKIENNLTFVKEFILGHCIVNKARLLMATIQYWILLVYCSEKKVSEEDCDIAIYSVMRVLNHGDKVFEEYYNAWKILRGILLKFYGKNEIMKLSLICSSRG